MAFALLPVALACDVGGSNMSVVFKKLLKYKKNWCQDVAITNSYGAETWDALESSSEMPWKFCNVVLKKDGEDRLHRLFEKWSITESREWNKRLTYSKLKEG